MEDDDEFGDLYTVPQISALFHFSSSAPPTDNPPEEPRNSPPPSNSRVYSSDGEKDIPRFDIEEGETGIPGIGEEDWEESESEGELKIVLNDTSGPRPGFDEDEDDDDDDELVIVADGDPPGQEEHDWGAGEEGSGSGGGDGERKQGGDAGKGGSGVGVGPKIGYSNHGYHPFHSQFKYVRPGAAPLPGATITGTVGAPGQVRPPLSMNLVAGRGRGDWRLVGIKGAPMQKGFYPGFARGNNIGGRGFGLDFALPSHKTIFDVDIDSFEEKPWKYPGVDMSDFFNFNLNEDIWKDYCKQLEQHRVETTMQSKIRVYEIGRGEQDYDPDMPPELAAATGIQDIPADKSILGKSDVGQSDLTKGPARVRPPIPIGRPIQVESGYGERLPSVNTRPPRFRNSDVVIEIICQDSLEDESSNGSGTGDGMGDDQPHDDIGESQVAEDDMKDAEAEYLDEFPLAYNGREGRKIAVYSNSREEDGNLSPLPNARVQHGPHSKEQPSANSSVEITGTLEERHTRVRSVERSSHSSSSQGTLDKRVHNHIGEDSVGDDGKYSLPLSSPSLVGDAGESSVKDKDDNAIHDLENAEASSGLERDEMDDQLTANDTTRDESKRYSSEKQKTIPALEEPELKELDDNEDSKAARSSESSRIRSNSHRERHKWQHRVDAEVIKDGHSARGGSVKKDLQENEMNRGRKDRGARLENERNHIVAKGKGRGNSYAHRDPDLATVYHLHVQNDSYDRHQEFESPDVALQWKNEDIISRKSRNEGVRKKEHGDDMGSRYKPKFRESERSDQDDLFHSKKYLENGYNRVPYEKDGISRHRERDDDLKSRYDNGDDYYRKRRKDEEYLRRDHYEKEEILHGQRDATNHRRRERGDALDPRNRDDHQRIKDNFDDYYSLKHEEEIWDQRERSKRQRREEFYRIQPSREENMLKQEREDGRGSARSAHGPDDKLWNDPIKAKDDYRSTDKDYQLKEAGQGSEYRKRKLKTEDESSSHHRGREEHAGASHIGNEEKKSRQDRVSTRRDHALDASDYERAHEKKQKQNLHRDRELEGGHNTSSAVPRKRNKEDHGGHGDEKVLKGHNGHHNTEKESAMQHSSSQRRKEEASSEDEQQDSRRGRSKLERWTSQKERDYTPKSLSSASLKIVEVDNKDLVLSEADKLPNGPTEKAEAVEKRSLEEAKVGEHNDTETKPLDDRHLDTVEKLKKRSERFKLPMPSEKDPSAIKKMKSEALPSVQTENTSDAEIKPERPARKRRWISN